MYAILLTNKWTANARLYPIRYNTQAEADKAHDIIPFSNTNWIKQTITCHANP